MPIDNIPPALRPPARRLRRFLLTDGAAVLILGAGIFCRGAFDAPRLIGVEWLGDSGVPPGWLPLLWMIIGALIMCSPLCKWRHREYVGILAGVAVNLIVGFGFIVDSFMRPDSPGWSPGVGYFSIAALVMWAVWRGKRGDVPLPGEGGRSV